MRSTGSSPDVEACSLARKGDDPQAVVWAEKTVEAVPNVSIGYCLLYTSDAADE